MTIVAEGIVESKMMLSQIVTAFPRYAPNALGRYSRYSIVPDFNVPPNPAPTYISENSYYPKPYIDFDNPPHLPSTYQWRTIHYTASKSCCGGGWIRKFTDGTHDWTNRNRITFDVENFKCINYSDTLIESNPDTTGFQIKI